MTSISKLDACRTCSGTHGVDPSRAKGRSRGTRAHRPRRSDDIAAPRSLPGVRHAHSGGCPESDCVAIFGSMYSYLHGSSAPGPVGRAPLSNGSTPRPGSYSTGSQHDQSNTVGPTRQYMTCSSRASCHSVGERPGGGRAPAHVSGGVIRQPGASKCVLTRRRSDESRWHDRGRQRMRPDVRSLAMRAESRVRRGRAMNHQTRPRPPASDPRNAAIDVALAEPRAH